MHNHEMGLNSTRLIRSFNAGSVLQALYKEGSASRGRLAKVTKISPATMTRIIAELIERKIIVEERIGESDRGRRPVILRLNYDRLFIAGAQIFRDRVVMAISDIKGNLTVRKIFRPCSLEPDSLITELANQFTALISGSRMETESILGIGVAVSGVVDNRNGIILRSSYLGWRDVKIAEMLEKELGVSIYIENDANASMLAEIWFGGLKDVSSAVFIKTALEVSLGVVYEHKLLTGQRGMPEEIGHINLMPEGRRCRCGHRGCLDAYLYLPDIILRYEQETGEHLENELQILSKAVGGQPVAKMLVDEALEGLATIISLVETMLDVEAVVIGDFWRFLNTEYLKEISDKLQVLLKKGNSEKTIIIKGSELGEDSGILGTIGLVINECFTPSI
jgi:Transcriptional regulator/sugar kinase